jgi:hypothetical protein
MTAALSQAKPERIARAAALFLLSVRIQPATQLSELLVGPVEHSDGIPLVVEELATRFNSLI